MAGQGDDLYLGPSFADGAGGGRPVHLWHHQVHQDHIGLKLLAQAQSLFASACLADQFQVRLDFQEGRQSSANHVVIVNDHYSNGI